jgi:hypothetical protein
LKNPPALFRATIYINKEIKTYLFSARIPCVLEDFPLLPMMALVTVVLDGCDAHDCRGECDVCDALG